MKKKVPFGLKIIGRRMVNVLLKPFTWLYGLVTTLRNRLYDNRILNSTPTQQFSVVVGNLTVGGTGKTPMIEYLIRNLSQSNQIVTLSRGYGRQSRGFKLASSESNAADIGDEPLQYYEKFAGKIPVAVCENRVVGGQRLHQLFPDHRLLLLDDAYQHRGLRPNLTIMLNDFRRPFFRDEPFPGGRLRETRHGARRANAIVTTKCPTDFDLKTKAEITRELVCYAAPGTPCFFASVRYSPVRAFDQTEVVASAVILVAGIAQPEPLVEHVRSNFALKEVKIFPDHFNYQREDVLDLLKNLKKGELILTTEKDMVKLRPLAVELNAIFRFAYLPIEIDFGSDTQAFADWLQSNVAIPARRLGKA